MIEELLRIGGSAFLFSVVSSICANKLKSRSDSKSDEGGIFVRPKLPPKTYLSPTQPNGPKI